MLEIKDVRVLYPNGTEALKSVTFSASKGELIAIVGRSGAGKSTLLRCINGLQPVASGKIVLDQDEITAMTDTRLNMVRRQIGFIWQEYNLIDRSSAMRNVLTGRLGYSRGFGSFIGYFGRADREIAVQSFERVNLLHRAGHRADRLSGGEKQRVSIARAMTQQPKLILADEPVASLDPGLAWQVLADLAKVSREDNVLTIINLHQIELAREFCDRIIGIAQGSVVFDGKPDELDQPALDHIYHFDRPISTLTATKRAEVLN